MTSKEIQQFVYDFLYEKNIPHKAICAIMGNISAESSWDPNSIEVGNNIGFGLIQWSFGRRTQLEAYGTDLKHQCEFLYSELTGNNLNVTGADFQWINSGQYIDCEIDRFLKAADTVEFLAEAFCWNFERPNYADAHIDHRRDEAVNFSNTMSYKGSGTVTPNPPTPGKDNIYDLIKKTPYRIDRIVGNLVQLLQSLKIGDTVHLEYTFNKRKTDTGYNLNKQRIKYYTSTEFVIKSIEKNGFILLNYKDSFIRVNPILLKK